MESPIPTAEKDSDRTWAAFTEAAPWNVDRAELTWLGDVDGLRARAAAELPRLITPPRVPPLARLVVVVAVLGRALVPWFVRRKLRRFATPEASRADLSRRMRRAIERLGSTYIKLAQIISSLSLIHI